MDNPSSTVRKAVCVGDYISLAATAPQEAYMHAQALVLTRLGARLTSGGELPPRFHEHVFRVVPALRYDSERARGLARRHRRARAPKIRVATPDAIAARRHRTVPTG